MMKRKKNTFTDCRKFIINAKRIEISAVWCLLMLRILCELKFHEGR